VISKKYHQRAMLLPLASKTKLEFLWQRTNRRIRGEIKTVLGSTVFLRCEKRLGPITSSHLRIFRLKLLRSGWSLKRATWYRPACWVLST